MITNLSLIALATFAATAAPLPQDPAPTQVEAEDEGWQVFDGVALIVNDEIVTLRQLNTSVN
ncbi:MAG: hypothetical protein ACI84E_002610, partial [Planctomycetota bacterium]